MKTVKANTFKPIAVLLAFVLLLGSVPSVFAYSNDSIEALGGSYFITDRGDLWVWGDSDNGQLGETNGILTMTRCSGTYSSFTVNGGVGNYVTSAGKLYRWSDFDNPFYMYDTVSGKLINANDESQCLMTGVDKAVGGDESSIFVLKENGDLWVIPYTAGKPYKALTDVTDVITANPDKSNEIAYALTKDRKVYCIENLLYVSKATVTRIASKVNAEALAGVTSTESLYLIDSNDELIEYNISRNSYNTVAQNIKSAAVSYTSGDIYTVTSAGTVTLNGNVISRGCKIVCVNSEYMIK